MIKKDGKSNQQKFRTFDVGQNILQWIQHIRMCSGPKENILIYSMNSRIFLYGTNFTIVLQWGIRNIFLYSVYSFIVYTYMVYLSWSKVRIGQK